MIIAYLRVSTSRQNLENQHVEIQRYAKNKGMFIDRWETEIVSGKVDRKVRKLEKLIRRLKTGDILIVTELSRLSRSLHEIMQIMKYCVDNKVQVHSTKDGYIFDDSINSKVLSFAFGLAAEIEHKLISQRTREAMAVRKAEGKHMGRRYGSDVKIQYLKKRKEEITERLIAGKSITSICTELKICYNTFSRFRKAYPEIMDYKKSTASGELLE